LVDKGLGKMGIRRIYSSNMDIFIRFTCYLVHPPTYFLTSSDIRKVLYLYKAFDVFWFQDFLPNNTNERITLYLNPAWPSEKLPYGVDQLASLDEILLRYLTDRIIKPQWLPSGVKFTISIADIIGPSGRPRQEAARPE
jgi:hypothetical protein